MLIDILFMLISKTKVKPRRHILEFHSPFNYVSNYLLNWIIVFKYSKKSSQFFNVIYNVMTTDVIHIYA